MNNMEADRNPFPQLELFPRISRAARFIGNLLTPFPTDAPDYMSDHYRGGAAMLDRELYDQVQVEGFLYDERQGSLFDGGNE